MKRARPDMRSLDSDPPGAAHAARNKWYPADTVFCLDRQLRHLSVACDRSGTLSASFAHYVGKSPRELRLDPRLDRRLRAECAALLRTGKPRVFEALVAGTRLTHRLVPERAHGGRITSILGIVRKVHDHRSTHAPAQAPQPSLADVTANMAELFQVVEPILDRRGMVTDFAISRSTPRPSNSPASDAARSSARPPGSSGPSLKTNGSTSSATFIARARPAAPRATAARSIPRTTCVPGRSTTDASRS